MPDSKITALTALTAADPANDMIPIVDVSDTPPASGNTKRISINNILACSPTATLASATISGDLTVATNRFAVSASGVGIGTTTMTYNLNVTGAAPTVTGIKLINTSGTSSNLCMFSAGSAYSSFGVPNNAGWLAVEGSNPLAIGPTGNGGIVFVNNGSEAMRLNSTGLGVGVSPSYNIHARGTTDGRIQIEGASGYGMVFIQGSSGNSAQLQLNSSGGSGRRYVVASNSSGQFIIGDETAVLTRFIIDSSGNVGIGVTPSAWRNTQRALQIGAVGGLFSSAASTGSTAIGRNVYENSAGDFTYIVNDEATFYEQTATGVHAWYSAAAGTGTISFGDAKMTLDASGRLILLASTTTPATLATNGQLTFTATSDTNLRFSYRGSDGVTRVANITLA